MIKRRQLCNAILGSVAMWAASSLSMAADFVVDKAAKVPEPLREFRGVWVTTVYNLDWPSKPGLPVAQQQRELTDLMDKAVSLNLNALVLQVRTMADAIYDSPIEPWSYYLTGEMGRAPEPYYDPLKFAVDEAHKRGLELHAWFNPFRATTASYGTLAENHIAKQYPWVVRKMKSHNWLDPSSDFVRDRIFTVIFDVVNRYDIDGVQIDDYFYPYPARGEPDFDDIENFEETQMIEGVLERSDWRRENVNRIVKGLYDEIKTTKPWVKFGVSPFGIWRPGYPSQVKAGLDSYSQIFADSKKWLNEGWLDYCSPQLYWTIDGPQGFAHLYGWWQKENTLGRHIWPGIASARIGRRGAGEGDGRDALEILNQISETRRQLGSSPASGQLHWRWNAFQKNSGGISRLITMKRYADRVLIPPSPWLESFEEEGELALPKPDIAKVEVIKENDEFRIAWRSVRGDERGAVRWWMVQTKRGDSSPWRIEHVTGSEGLYAYLKDGSGITQVAMRAVGKTGQLGPVVALKKK